MRPPQFAGESQRGGGAPVAADAASMRPPQFAGESPEGPRMRLALNKASMRPPQFAGESTVWGVHIQRREELQ